LYAYVPPCERGARAPSFSGKRSYHSFLARFRFSIAAGRHAFVHQKIGFPVQNVRADHTHAGLSDVRDGTFSNWRDQQGDGPGRALRWHQVPAGPAYGRVVRVQLHVTRTLRRIPRSEIVSICRRRVTHYGLGRPKPVLGAYVVLSARHRRPTCDGKRTFSRCPLTTASAFDCRVLFGGGPFANRQKKKKICSTNIRKLPLLPRIDDDDHMAQYRRRV